MLILLFTFVKTVIFHRTIAAKLILGRAQIQKAKIPELFYRHVVVSLYSDLIPMIIIQL
jgi:hypothetical protein